MVVDNNLFGAGVIFVAESLAFRWFIFEYKKLAPLRNLILRGFLSELSVCTFCQGFEAGLVIYLLSGFPINIHLFFWPLTAGFICLISEPFFQKQISEVEKIKHFSFSEKTETENIPTDNLEEETEDSDYLLGRLPKVKSWEGTNAD